MAVNTKIKTKTPTTTLAISGLGPRSEDIEKALASGMFVPGTNLKKRLNLLLYGPPGTAKTVTAHGLPNTRTLDLDNGMQSVDWAIRKGILKKDPSEIVFKTILPDPKKAKSTHVIDEAAEAVDEWILEEDIDPSEWDRPYPQFWDTLIIDSGSALTDSAIILALKENDRLGLSKSYTRMLDKLSITPMMIQDWGSAASLFQKFINNVRAIGKNVVLICHEYVDTDDSGSVISIDPLLIGQLRGKIPKDFDEVWYAHVTGTRNDPKYKLQTTPDPLHRLRSRLGCLDPVESGDFNAIKKKVSKFYSVPEEELWVAYHGTEGAERAMKEMMQEEGASI